MDKPLFNKSRLLDEFDNNKFKLKKHLNDVMASEIKNPVSQINADKIKECADFILELDEQKINISQEEILARAKSSIGRYYKPHRKRSVILRLLAVCLAFICSVQFILLAAFNINFLGSTYALTKQTLSRFAGGHNHNDSVRKYNTIQEFEDGENINISMPSYMPCDLEVDVVKYSADENVVDIIFASGAELDVKLSFCVISNDVINQSKKYTHNGIDFYLSDDFKELVWVSENCLHSLVCYYLQNEFMQIIENIK